MTLLDSRGQGHSRSLGWWRCQSTSCTNYSLYALPITQSATVEAMSE